MTKELDRPFVPAICLSTYGSGHAHRLMEMMMHRPDPVFVAFPPVWEPTPIPEPNLEDLMVNHINPLFHTPAAIHRSVAIGGAVSKSSNKLKLAMTVALLSSTTHQTHFRLTSTGGLRERVKSLEKTLQKHPGRNDIKLQIMELRNQIREIDSENAKARQAQKAAKGKQRK